MNIYKNKVVRYLGIKMLRKYSRHISSEKYLKLLFPLRTGYKLDLENPVTFNQKLQWLKLYDQDPRYSEMVDKAQSKEYVTNIIGEGYTVPTLGVYDDVEDIDFDEIAKAVSAQTLHDEVRLIADGGAETA